MDVATKLVVGLGNPGKEYEGTRHNIGFEVVDRLANRHRIAVAKRDFRALVGDGRIGDTRVFLMKPLTFMNLSGESLAAVIGMGGNVGDPAHEEFAVPEADGAAADVNA